MTVDKTPKESGQNVLKVAERTLHVLERICEHPDSAISVTGLSRELGFNKTVIHRILKTLTHRGYLVQDPQFNTYSVGYKLIELGARAQEKSGLSRIARPVLEQLARESGETVNLGVLHGSQVVYLDKIESTNFLRTDLRVGTHVPAYCSGLGKVLLCYSNETPRVLVGETFERHTAKTLTSPEDLSKALELVRKEGYSLDDEEYIPGVRCLAVPIFDNNKGVVAALSIAGPTFRLPDERIPELVALLKGKAYTLSAKLGFQTTKGV